MVNFRINAKNFFITFPQCNLPKDLALKHFTDKHGPNLLYALICKEKHADGEDHLHLLLKFANKVNVQSCNYFDIAPFHGHIEAVNDEQKVYEYIIKGKDQQEYVRSFIF